jgi:4-hydroxy-2-oxoheptanedioate aldolase
MKVRPVVAAVGAMVSSVLVLGQAQPRQRLNPIIDLLDQKKPVFGLYAPSAGRGNRGVAPGTTAAALPPARTPADLVKDALAYSKSDFLFNGGMEGSVDRGLPAFADFANAMRDAATPALRWSRPLVVKTPKIAPDSAKAAESISRQLNLGVSGIVLVSVESADEVRQGLAAMRFTSKGGTRPDEVGSAPAYWGMTEQQYKERADLWPLNRNGELVNWTIVESKEGLAHVREIAAVKGIGVLFPGAGTLRGVFSSTNADGQRVVDTVAWEGAIQQVLAACKEFNVACGYPATADDIEMRMKQGFSVFIMSWGDPGFKAVDIGRQLAGRSTSSQE